MALGAIQRASEAPDSEVTLSPWPGNPSARERAIAMLRSAVAGRADESDEYAHHLGQTASDLVERYAPDAPQAIKNEAVIRFAGYLAQSDFGSVVRESGLPGHDVEYTVTHQNAFRNSGAAMLLTRWRIRRAGAIG